MHRITRGFALAVGAALVAFVAFAAYALIQLNSTMRNQSPPDVAKVANSAPVGAADQLATARMDAALAEVAAAGAGTAPGPSAVLDQCQSQRGGMWVETWSPVGCTRRVTAYFAFDGDFERQMQSWSAALAAKGWHSESNDALAQPLAYYKAYHQTSAGQTQPGDANATNPYLASDLPSSGQLCKRSASDAPVCLHFDWAERPRTKDPLYSVTAPDETAVRQRHDVDPTQTESADFAGARYVAIVTMADAYYTPSLKPNQTPAPSKPNPSYSPCYSGSHNCY